MKLYKILLSAALVGVLVPQAYGAITKCVKGNFYRSQPVSAIGTQSGTNYPFMAKVPAGINTPSVVLVTYCASTAAASGAVADSITISGTVGDNMYCWIRMVSPVISQWISASVFATAGECIQNCTQWLINNSEFGLDVANTLMLTQITD